jgi:L-rhamnose-H+ transport protein
MSGGFWLGTTIISASGLLNGTFALPMKYIRKQQWENMWLLSSFVGRVLVVALALALVPHLGQVYSGAPIQALLVPIGFGLLLGIGQVLYGLSIAAVGTSIAIAVVSGVSCVSGALIPLIVFHPNDLFHSQGLFLLASIPMLLVGLVFYGVAGRRRESEHTVSRGVSVQLSAAVSLIICIVTGILGSSINLGFAFSGGITQASINHGANAFSSTYAVWALLFAASFVPNLLYTSYLLTKNRTWLLFTAAGTGKDSVLSLAIAVLSMAAFVGYGIGATAVGSYGTSVGWALFVAATVITSTVAGLLMGEWHNSAVRTRRILFFAVAMILVSVVVLDLGGIF